MRKQLDLDIKGCSNKDLSEQLKNALEDLDALQTAFNAVLAKLDADAGVTDTDYVSAQGVTASLDID